jgi:hypothetical protein
LQRWYKVASKKLNHFWPVLFPKLLDLIVETLQRRYHFIAGHLRHGFTCDL